MKRKTKIDWKAERIKTGMSQIEVAKKFGYLSSQFISNWERGLANPPPKILAKLCVLYNLDREDVLQSMMHYYEVEIRKALKI